MLNFGNKEFRNLQEQVLKNAQDIEILKEKPSLRIVIVEELPETGEEGILYLVPKDPDPDTGDADSYDEYVWLPEEETFELVGNTAIDLSNMVTTDTDQTITGDKAFIGDTTVANLTSEGDIETEGKVIIGATGYDIKKDGSNMVIEADGNAIKVRGDVIPNSGSTYTLGNASSNRWKTLYLSHYVDWGNNAMIYKDSSNRVVISAAGNDRIKIGTINSTYCVANWVPDVDSTYDLGKDNMRWAAVNAGRVQNKYSSFFIEANGDVNVKCSNSGGLVPSSNNLFSIGKSGQIWSTVYANSISDGTNTFNVANIATKPNYANPNVFADGTLNGSGQDTIDISAQGVGVPGDGLYMFTYGNCQCFLSLTSTMIQNATQYPIRCPCPTMYSGSAYPGILKIERAADVLTLTVATAGVGVVQPSGYEWKLIKVM